MLFMLTLAAALALLDVWAHRSGGPRRLWGVAAVGALALAAYSLSRPPAGHEPAGWLQLPSFFVLPAALAALLTAVAVWALGRRHAPWAVQALAAAATAFLLLRAAERTFLL